MNRVSSKTVILPFRARPDSDASGDNASSTGYLASTADANERDRTTSKTDSTPESQADGEA